MASLKDISLENRNRSWQQGQNLLGEGNDIQSGLDADVSGYGSDEAAYRSKVNDSLDNLEQTPGYTSGEAAGIGRDYTGLQTGADALGGRQLTDAEKGAIMGNPNAAQGFYDPSKLTGMAQDSTGKQLTATGGLKSGMSDAINPAAQNKALGDEGTGLVSSFGDEKTATEAAVDPSKLGVSSDYASTEKMTPQQQQDIETAAGTSVGNRYQSDIDQLNRSAAAQGNTSPMAVAAATRDYERDAAAQAGDAETNARIAASNAAAGREQTAETTRLGAEEDISSRKQQNAQTLGQQQLSAVERYGQQGIDIGSQTMQDRLNAAQVGGEADIATADRTGQEEQQTEAGNQATGQKLATAADVTGSQRAGEVAGNRQQTTADVQNTQFNQGMTTGQATAAGQKQVADTRIAGDTAYRAGVAGQESEAQTGQQTAEGQKIGAYGAQTGTYGAQNSGTNNATQTAVQANAQPSTFDKVLGTVAGAAAGAAKAGAIEDGSPRPKPGLAILAEHGPEWVGKIPKTGFMDGGGITGSGEFDGPEGNSLPGGTPDNSSGEYQPTFREKLQRYMKSVGGGPSSTPAAGSAPASGGGGFNPVSNYQSLGYTAGNLIGNALKGGSDSNDDGAMYSPDQQNQQPGPARYGVPDGTTPPVAAQPQSQIQGLSATAPAPQTQPQPQPQQQQPQPQQSPQQQQSWSAAPKAQGSDGASAGGWSGGSSAPRQQQGPARYGSPARQPQGMADGGVILSKPTLAKMEAGDAVVPFNRTNSTKMPPALANSVLRSRYRRPTGPAGPHGPIRPLEPLKGSPAYR